jgi:hypothetical protein
MTHRKDAEPVRTTRESEIFRDPPGSGNYSNSIGAAQGIELFSGSGRVHRALPTKTVFEPARQIPVLPKLTCSRIAPSRGISVAHYRSRPAAGLSGGMMQTSCLPHDLGHAAAIDFCRGRRRIG